jgi:hypothetical protein
MLLYPPERPSSKRAEEEFKHCTPRVNSLILFRRSLGDELKHRMPDVGGRGTLAGLIVLSSIVRLEKLVISIPVVAMFFSSHPVMVAVGALPENVVNSIPVTASSMVELFRENVVFVPTLRAVLQCSICA